METFGDVLRRARDLRGAASSRNGLPAGVDPKTRLAVPNEKALLLPVDAAGYSPIAEDLAGAGSSILGEYHSRASAALICSPGFVAGLRRPSLSELARHGYDLETARASHNPRALAASVAVDLPSGRFWGVGRLLAVEGGIRPGSTMLLDLDAHWADNPDLAEARLAATLEVASDSVIAAAEPSGRPWRRIAVLLGAPAGSPGLAPDLRRHLELVAGLRRVRITFRVNPDGQRTAVVRDLRSSPPDAVLIWSGGVSDRAAYEAPYLAARPEGYVETFGTADGDPLLDLREELLLHLREFSPLEDEGRELGEEYTTWDAAARAIRGMAGEHMTLSTRADAMLDGNPYPLPGRMVEHMRALDTLARRYHQAKGNLGAPLSDVAAELGIEIALTDKGLAPPVIRGFQGLRAEPHVKVDDYKSPADCGRIYFALDRTGWRFVVDHIGLHDYC